jgi:hypothetical protein
MRRVSASSTLETGIALGHTALHVDSTAHRIDYARKLEQQTVACGLDDPAAVLSDLGVHQFPAVGL